MKKIFKVEGVFMGHRFSMLVPAINKMQAQMEVINRLEFQTVEVLDKQGPLRVRISEEEIRRIELTTLLHEQSNIEVRLSELNTTEVNKSLNGILLKNGFLQRLAEIKNRISILRKDQALITAA